MKTNKIIPGMICAFDPNNILGEDSLSFTHARVISRLKWRPFGRSIWKIQPIMNNMPPHIQELSKTEMYTCIEKVLYPCNMYIIRNPIDIPTINDVDISTLKSVISSLDTVLLDGNILLNLNALKEKLEFYKSMKEV